VILGTIFKLLYDLLRVKNYTSIWVTIYIFVCVCIFPVTVAEFLEGGGHLIMFEQADNGTADPLRDILEACYLLVEADQVGTLFSGHVQIGGYRDQISYLRQMHRWMVTWTWTR
jgi:hypothetical protein